MNPSRGLVIAKVFGGLGNQMFQYAAGRTLADRLRLPMEIDTRASDREGAAHNGFELSRVFLVDPVHATARSVGKLLGWRSPRTVQRVLRRLRMPSLCEPYVPEPHFHYWRAFDELRGPCYLDGYWQSFLYFSPNVAQLRTDFRFRLPFDGENARIADQIAAAPDSVSIHVRRGDYVASGKAASHHGTASIDYYQAAVALVATRLTGAPRLFVFSDDIAWARSHLALPDDTVFVAHNTGADSHFDMRLMSCCRHNIIANSSFSWWAAWLNPNSEKIVIAPSRWVLAPYDTTTLTPPSWTRI